jgi:hypothetical protein
MIGKLKNYGFMGNNMPKGLKATSSMIQISGSVVETTANAPTSERIDLQLNALDQEVFVVQAVDLGIAIPENRANATTNVTMTLSSTPRAAVGSISMPSTIAYLRNSLSNVEDTCAVLQESRGGETPPACLEYVYIIATNDFYANIQGSGNSTPKGGSFRVYGYRARADAATYAALVQSELLSE